MRVILDFKPYPKYKPSKSGETICITNIYTMGVYDYSKKYDAFNAQDNNSEEFTRENQLNNYIVGFCEVNDKRFMKWIGKLNKENEEENSTTEQQTKTIQNAVNELIENIDDTTHNTAFYYGNGV